MVKSHAKVDSILQPMPWGEGELRYVIQSIRRRVVHCEYDPTVEEALRAVRIFFQLWKEKTKSSDEKCSLADSSTIGLEKAAELCEGGAEWILDGTQKWDVSVERAACSTDIKERIKAVKQASSAMRGQKLLHALMIKNPERDFGEDFNKAYSLVGCEMRYDDMTYWACLLGERVTAKKYKPSLPEAHRAVQVFKKIFHLLSIADYSPDTSLEDLYRQNFAKIYTDTEPKYPDLIGQELNINKEAVIDLADQLGITFDVLTGLIKADEALLICQSFKNGLLTPRVETKRVTLGDIVREVREVRAVPLPRREEPEEENPFAAADREPETRRRVIIRRRW